MTADLFPHTYQWATLETTYPAGSNAWNSQPIIVQPVADYFTPNTKPPAENLNFVLNQFGSASPSVLAACAFVSVNNWLAPVTVTDTVDCSAWDPVNGVFCTAVRNSTAHTATIVCATGTWTTVSSVSKVTAILKDPTDKKTLYMAVVSTGNHAQVYRFDSSAGTATLIVDDPSRTFTDVKVAYLNGHLIYTASESSSTVSYIASDNANQGASFGSSTTFSGTFVLLQTNGSQLLAIGAMTTNPSLVTSSNGTVFTIQATGFSGQLPSSVASIQGLAWGADAQGAAWFFGHVRTDLSKTKWLRSADGVTWTTPAGNVSTANWGFATGALVAVGGLLVSLADNGAGMLRVMTSVDGATTWQITPTPFAFFNARSLSASPTGFLLGLGGNLYLSLAQGLTQLNAT